MTCWRTVSRVTRNVFPTPDQFLSFPSPTAGSHRSSHCQVGSICQFHLLPPIPAPFPTPAPTRASSSTPPRARPPPSKPTRASTSAPAPAGVRLIGGTTALQRARRLPLASPRLLHDVPPRRDAMWRRPPAGGRALRPAPQPAHCVAPRLRCRWGRRSRAPGTIPPSSS